jgi:hypothetical protein
MNTLCCLAEAEAPKGEANFWSAFPSMLWVGLILLALAIFYGRLSELLGHLIIRVRSGVGVKIGAVEIGALRTEQHHHGVAEVGTESMTEEQAKKAGDPTAEAKQLAVERKWHLENTRSVMLAHCLFRSTKPGQVYDVLIYLVPYGDGNLVQVTKVEYFFGRYWGNKVFPSSDRSRGFPILTSAYGPFLCCARVHFTAGPQANPTPLTATLFRYIDFEMGAYAPLLDDADGAKAGEKKSGEKKEGEA